MNAADPRASAERLPQGEARALVCGIARNCGGTLGPSIAALRQAAGGFRHVAFLVVESDSTDDTVAVLERLEQSDPSFRHLALGSLRHRMKERTERIAHCRNRIVDELSRNDAYCDVDYVVVADLDGVNLSLMKAALEHPWQSAAPWDAVMANQEGPYYDVWALRHAEWSPNDCWRAFAVLRPLFGEEAAFAAAVTARQMKLPPTAEPVEVESAFGGLGIYTRSAFLAGRYRGRDDDGQPVCEHVPFHRDLRVRGYRLFIDPALLNSVQHEHLSRPSFPRKLQRKLRGLWQGG